MTSTIPAWTQLEDLVAEADRLLGHGFLSTNPAYLERCYELIATNFLPGIQDAYGDDSVRGAGTMLSLLRKAADSVKRTAEFDVAVLHIGSAACAHFMSDLIGHEEEVCANTMPLLLKAPNFLEVIDRLGRKSGRPWMVGQMAMLELLRRAGI